MDTKDQYPSIPLCPPCRSSAGILLAIVLMLSFASPSAAADPKIVTHGDAFVAHADGTQAWTIGSANLEFTVGFDASKRLTPQRLANPVTGRTWSIDPTPDATATLNGEQVALADTAAALFLAADASETSDGVRLTFTFEHRGSHVRIARTYVCYPGSPTIEAWTTLDASAATIGVQASDLIGWELTLPAGTVHWTTGLRGDSADSEQSAAFVLTAQTVPSGGRVEIGSPARSSEQFVPFATVDGDSDQFFGGVMWSGSWRMGFERSGDRLHVWADFPGITSTLSAARPLELPHAFFGIASTSSSTAAAALSGFLLGVRHGRPLQALVTYNTWYAYGTDVDENSMLEEIGLASTLGIELVVVDAGWWSGAGTHGTFDFTTGLGNWTVDRSRFPSGLARLSDFAHARGIKFGIWVEPERVALGTVGKSGLADESWLATHDGQYGPQDSALICLAHAPARQWVRDHVVALIDAARPDYVKWDNNAWTNCNRDGHGHGASDGNFAHVQALYGLFDELRQRYPNIMFENVSSGGNRLDFGMAPFTDVAWMSDRTFPSVHVRHNVEGLSYAFPPGYLLSFAIDTKDEPIDSSSVLPLVMRSRMPGVLGLTYKKSQVPDRLASDLRGFINAYKSYRDAIVGGTGMLLTAQAPVDGWDAVEDVSADGSRAVLFAFKSDNRSGSTVVHPKGLRSDATYRVVSADTGDLGVVAGDVLMRDGIQIVHSGGSQAHVIQLTAQ